MRRLLFPGSACTSLLLFISVVALLITFSTGGYETFLGYASYVLSTYTLVVLALKIPNLLLALWEKGKNLLYGKSKTRRIMTDNLYRTTVFLCLSLAANLAFALYKLIAGILYSSLWFISVSIYYIVLGVIRFQLLGPLRKDRENMIKQWRSFRFCGGMLLIFTVALRGMVIQMVCDGKGYQYPGHLIYAVALYAFFCTTLSIINLFKNRRLNSPALSAAKIINLAKSLVAILTMQTAMFASFGGDEHLQHMINAITGGCVCTAIFIVAVFMVIQGNHKIKSIQEKKNSEIM